VTLPVFILIAVALPIAVLALFWASSKLVIWSWLHPRGWGVILILVGVVNLFAAYVERNSKSPGWLILTVVMAVLFIGMGLLQWFRGQPVWFE
jgi:uncharacterized membrane protein HdeD (DUF308 family)